MPTPSNMPPIPRRALPIFYVLDTSGSMIGEKIERLNHAMEETTDALKQVAATNGDAQIKVAVLEFNSLVRWVQPAGPEDMEDFIWQDLHPGGMTHMGAALCELESKLHSNGFLKSDKGSLMPVIIFMTDGFANDDYSKGLLAIRQNKYFERATKIGFAIGEDADVKMIAEVVGDPEAVIKTDDLGLFARLIRFVSVASTTMASKSQVATGDIKGSTVLHSVLESEGIGDFSMRPSQGSAPEYSTDTININLDDLTWDTEEW